VQFKNGGLARPVVEKEDRDWFKHNVKALLTDNGYPDSFTGTVKLDGLPNGVSVQSYEQWAYVNDGHIKYELKEVESKRLALEGLYANSRSKRF
jgi:hypothetical protein